MSSSKKNKRGSTAARRPITQTSARRNRSHKSGAQTPIVGLAPSVLPGPWQFNVGIFCLLVAATAVLYAGDLGLGFFRIDDPQYVASNVRIQGITWEHLRQIFSKPYYLNYSPLHLLSYMLDHAIGGLNARAFHLSSNLWAGIVAGLVYLVALALTQRRAIAVAAGVLFVAHPAHVEAVAWISSRKDLVAAAFALPSFLAYLKYRRQGALAWYVVSLFMFVCALLGKLSVAAFPAVLLSVDLFMERRPFRDSILDKIPFLLAAAAVAMPVQHAQPGTGVQPDASMRAQALLQGVWLLSGLGTYVLYRVPPANGSLPAQIVGAITFALAFLLPLLLRKRYPLATVLIYWMLFTYLPTQILPFAYPVTDRYLFLPSAGAAILIACLLFKVTDRLPKWNLVAAVALVAVVSLVWLKKTVDYLSEWQDPRSVWFAATRKSQDFHVYYELGWEYLDKARRFEAGRKRHDLPIDEARRYASAVWKNDSRLTALLTELSDQQRNGPVEKAFRDYLYAQAAANFDQALARKGDHVAPNLFLSRGLLFTEKGDLNSAKTEFLAAVDDVSALQSSDTRLEALVSAHYNLAVVEQRLGHLKEALSWITQAEAEQEQLGRTVVPELIEGRKKLESMAEQAQ